MPNSLVAVLQRRLSTLIRRVRVHSNFRNITLQSYLSARFLKPCYYDVFEQVNNFIAFIWYRIESLSFLLLLTSRIFQLLHECGDFERNILIFYLALTMPFNYANLFRRFSSGLNPRIVASILYFMSLRFSSGWLIKFLLLFNQVYIGQKIKLLQRCQSINPEGFLNSILLPRYSNLFVEIDVVLPLPY